MNCRNSFEQAAQRLLTSVRPASMASTHTSKPSDSNAVGDNAENRLDHAQKETERLAKEVAGAIHGRGRTPEELEKALLSIRQARDTVLARNLEITGKLAAAEDRISELEYEREAADNARDDALKLVQELSQTSDELREKVLALGVENSALEQGKRDAEHEAEIARKVSAEAPSHSEFDEARRKLADTEAENAQLKALLEKSAASLNSQLAAAARARDIAVGAVTNAQRQIEHLSAERKALRAQVDADRAAFEARLAHVESLLPAHGLASSAAEPESESPPSSSDCVVPAEDPTGTVAAISACIDSLATEPGNLEILEDLDERFHGFAATSGGGGRAALARFSSACGEFTRWLRKSPRKVPTALDSLRGAAALLAELSKSGALELVADPAGALVYSVDDDVDNCECVAMSLEKMALQTRYAIKPEIALADISAGPYDLIILDVDLPGMNGFDLSERIREFAHHRATPIIFLSGLMSAKERLETLSGGGHAFVAKPYNLNELAVTALGMILKARLAKLAPAS